MKPALLCLALLAGAIAIRAQAPSLAEAQHIAIDDTVSRFMAKTHVPGVSVAIVENGSFTWSGGYGFADLEGNVPATAHTLYRLASLSKPITAVAAMELYERGKLNLDEPVQKYCPSFPVKPWPVTTREVMGHLGGIRHYRAEAQADLEIGNTKHFDDPIQGGLDFFKNDPLVAQPDTKFNYSTQGFTLVGCVIEGAAHAKYVEFVRDHVFTPAGMTQSQVDDRFTVIRYRTRFYSKDPSGRVINSDFLDSSYKIPGGGWLSSADDMARFELAMFDNSLLTQATRDLMWSPQKVSDGTIDSYGMGWGIKTIAGMTTIAHTGAQQGTSTAIVLVPQRKLGIVVLTNMDGAGAGDLAASILSLLTK